MPAYRIVTIEPHPLDELAAEFKARFSCKCFFQSRIRKENSEFARSLRYLGFDEVEELITFEAPISNRRPRERGEIRSAVEVDRERVVEIARHAYTHSRFHRDSLIPNVVADKIKANWTAGFFDGTRGDDLLVASVKGRVSGYLLLIEREDKLIIDLIAVDKLERGSGLAKALVEHAMERAPNHIKLMSAGTSETNRNSISFYEALGFSRTTHQLTFHKHGHAVE